MPLTRYQARNEYGLADPDLYQAADKDDPEALLEGVAMAGLVGILRQLGDLAEFAAEMFHDLHEEVMATASRSHGLMARVQQLEAELPFAEKALLCQTDHSPFFSIQGVEWHPNLQLEQSVVTRGDLPRCVMNSYEECRGPPRLFLLDKFDISGAGACLKRYTDPSFVKLETSSYESSWDDIQREKKSQKVKRRASHLRNGGTPENALTSHAKLHELFLEEHLEIHRTDPSRVVKLKTRKLDGYSLISKSGESYMGKFVQTSVDNRTGFEMITPNHLEPLTWNMDSARDGVTDIPDISMVDDAEKANGESRSEGSIEKDIETVFESTHNGNGKLGFFQYRSYSEDITSEAENYVDAPATMESETETDDEYSRGKNKSGALKDGNHHTYSDVDKERIEDTPQHSFFHSVGNTPVSENEQSSFGKRSSSFSYLDTASVSIDDQSDGEKSSGRLPSTSSIRSDLVVSTSHPTPEANKVSHDFTVQESVSSSNADGQTSFISNDTCSSPRSVSLNTESCSPAVQSLAPEVIETSPEFVRLDLIKVGNDGSEVDPVDSSRSGVCFDVKNSNFPSETSSISSTSEGSRSNTTVEKNCMIDYSSNFVNSGTSSQVFGDSQTGKQLPVADNDVETNSSDACSKVLANSDSDTKSRDGISLTEKLLPCSAGTGMEVSPDIPSKICGPVTVDEIHLEDTLDDETDCVTVTNVVAGIDSQTSVADGNSKSSIAEIFNRDSCVFGTTADVSVSESHEVKLENGMSISNEVDSNLTNGFNSGGEELVGDASPTSSKGDEPISDKPIEFHSSYLHDEGFHDLPGLDNTATDIVPNVDLAVSDNHADTSCNGVNHTVSMSSTNLVSSLPWFSTNMSQSSSEAGEICHDPVVESNGTLPAENNPESENNMQKIASEVSSESLGTSLDNNDISVVSSESCESLSPMTSLDQSDRDTCKSILDYNCIDSSPVNNLNLLESATIEKLVEVQTPCASHAFADEELKQSSVSRGKKFLRQSAGLELNSPKQELNLDPTFPCFGLIPETTPPNQEEMPPLPPLPPMQWRIGKASQFFLPTFLGESAETSNSALSAAPSELSISLGSEKSEQLPGDFLNNAAEKPLQSSSFASPRTQSADHSAKLPTMPNQGLTENFGSEENGILDEHAALNHELVSSQDSSLQLHLHQDPSTKDEDIKNETDLHVSPSSDSHYNIPGTKALTPTQSTKVEDNDHSVPDASNAETAEPSNSSVQKIIPVSMGDAMWPVRSFTVAPTLDTKKLDEVPMIKLHRPRSPLVDAVAAHDRRTMKKVSERIQPPIKSKQDDKDSFLAEIRNKSISLKPAASTRPSIQTGPRTNLRVAAILEKANTIRQAMAGSDEDEDSDSWSDS